MPRRWVRDACRRRARPDSVRTASAPRASTRQALRSTRPSATSRSIRRVTPLLLRITRSDSWRIRMRRPGAWAMLSSASYSASDRSCSARRSSSRRRDTRACASRKARQGASRGSSAVSRRATGSVTVMAGMLHLRLCRNGPARPPSVSQTRCAVNDLDVAGGRRLRRHDPTNPPAASVTYTSPASSSPNDVMLQGRCRGTACDRPAPRAAWAIDQIRPRAEVPEQVPPDERRRRRAPIDVPADHRAVALRMVVGDDRQDLAARVAAARRRVAGAPFHDLPAVVRAAAAAGRRRRAVDLLVPSLADSPIHRSAVRRSNETAPRVAQAARVDLVEAGPPDVRVRSPGCDTGASRSCR